MLGAIAGDIIGSVYEHKPIKTKEFPMFVPESRFTDDTVLTVAIAHALLDDRDYTESLRSIRRLYPDAGYGKSFMTWLAVEDHPSTAVTATALPCVYRRLVGCATQLRKF